MSAAFRAAVTSAMLLLVACEFRNPARQSDNYAAVYPFLEKWANTTKTALLTVLLDDHGSEDASGVPRNILNHVNVPVRLITLDHVISLNWQNQGKDYRVIEPGGCVLFRFSRIDSLKSMLNPPHLTSLWHPDSLYILQSLGSLSFCDLERFCRRTFERLWRSRRIYKIIFLDGGSSKAIRPDPFRVFGGGCAGGEEDFLRVNYANLTDVSDFFEARLSFGKCPLRIAIFESTTMTKTGDQYGGVDYRYLEAITGMMNVTPILIPEKDKHGWSENGVFFGTLGQLINGHSDLSFNQFFVKYYLTKRIQFTNAITSDKLCVLVPKAPPVPEYLVILKTFTGHVWLLILSSYFVIAIIYTSLKGSGFANTIADSPQGSRRCKTERKSHEHRGEPRSHADQSEPASEIAGKNDAPLRGFAKRSRPRRLERVIFPRLMILVKYLTKVMLQPTQPFENCKPSFPERLFVICSLWLGLILNGVFTSQLAASFSRLHYYDDIDTLEQLEESGLAILTSSRDIIEDALTDTTSPILKRLRDRMMYANETEINRRLFRSKDAAYLYQLTILPFKYNEYQRRKLHIMKECPKDYILAHIIPEGSPFLGRVNNILARLNNAGFYGKWYRDHTASHSSSHVLPEDESITRHRRITVRHLLIPFAICQVGLSLATIVFICERRETNRVESPVVDSRRR
ncbi:uncharacterized protein LOC143361274 [Halictus rubicundus]|uniref:uncharacterized protein LOC143361274 n=1 Tax=Halictus rubicundus TaxID=77578 RepID=UPI004036ED59